MPAREFFRSPHAVGIFWMLLSILCFTASMTVARGLADDVPVFVMVFFRALFGVLVMLPWLARVGLGGLRTGRIGLFTVRSVLAAANLGALFYALGLMPVADVTAISFIRPLLVTVFALYILGEAAVARQWTGLAIGLVGTLILLRPGFQEINMGALMALASAVLMALVFNVAKLLTRTESPDAIAFYQTFLMLPIAVVPAILMWQTPSLTELAWLFAMGAFATLSHRAMSRAYAAVELTYLAPLDFLRLPTAALLGLIAFAEVPDHWVWIGGAVIFAASVYAMRRRAEPVAR
jgi:drug/metabolite transporter (DMT)-like permease